MDAARSAMRQLAAMPLPGAVACRRQEGFAFYAVYPEAYVAAARRLGECPGAVIGIRSIGIGLAAIVSAATAAPFMVSVRPIGPPFARRLALAPELQRRLAACTGQPVAVVDEGPGLSGSSFLAVGRALRSLGCPARRVHFFPSHGGLPGAAASDADRAAWQHAPRHVASFEDVVLPHLASWVADLTGPAVEPLEDMSAGEWRRHHPLGARLPAQPMWERRKYLLRSERGRFLLRFAGLGRYGEAVHRRARVLAEAGLSPPVLGLRYGFLVEEWIEDARMAGAGQERAGFLAHVAAYLAFRAQRLPATPDRGASLDELARMLVHNASEALEQPLPEAPWLSWARMLEPRVRRIETDGRLHRWEWLCTRDGRVLKCDGYDHCDGHDIVGCQDVAWDVTGAVHELDLTRSELLVVLERLGAHGVSVDLDLLRFLWPCYLAFQLGCIGRSDPGSRNGKWSDNALAQEHGRYTAQLKKIICAPCGRYSSEPTL
ncbi:hypothetical protein GCM10010994_40980 [Chelatococcus reniformis]|uniref:Uncharacterized protein n=2 Tax=Chelatococcus reniformis TaxID=1494448 RepID=A0A916UM60_9HYPH|nr:hypothetical protein GCM10010994_40980 [Chelatococcus reniformis]